MTIQKALKKNLVFLENDGNKIWAKETATKETICSVSGSDDKQVTLAFNSKGIATCVMV